MGTIAGKPCRVENIIEPEQDPMETLPVIPTWVHGKLIDRVNRKIPQRFNSLLDMKRELDPGQFLAIHGSALMLSYLRPTPYYKDNCPKCCGMCPYYVNLKDDVKKPWGTCFVDSSRVIPEVGNRLESSLCNPWLKYFYRMWDRPPDYINPPIPKRQEMPEGLPSPDTVSPSTVEVEQKSDENVFKWKVNELIPGEGDTVTIVEDHTGKNVFSSLTWDDKKRGKTTKITLPDPKDTNSKRVIETTFRKKEDTDE